MKITKHIAPFSESPRREKMNELHDMVKIERKKVTHSWLSVYCMAFRFVTRFVPGRHRRTAGTRCPLLFGSFTSPFSLLWSLEPLPGIHFSLASDEFEKSVTSFRCLSTTCKSCWSCPSCAVTELARSWMSFIPLSATSLSP